MSDLADELRIARRSATAVVDELVARGLVERRSEPSDRRAVIAAMTQRGRTLLATLTANRHDAARDVLAPLSAAELRRLHRLLARIERR